MPDLYIPTYGRVGRQATWDAMPHSWRSRVALVARPEEAEALRTSTGATVLVAPVRGISNTRQWIFDQHEGSKLLMFDFDLHLQMLTRGYPSVMLNAYTKDDFGSNMPGGCSTYRDNYGQMLASLMLWENWPEFVKIRSVKAKWAGIGERYDVTVQWGKAYVEGCQRRYENGEVEFPVPDWARETSLF